MKIKKLGLSVAAAATLFGSATALAAEVDPWEKAAEDYLANKPKDEVVKPKEETAKPKEEAAKPKDEMAKPKDEATEKPVIDEEYVRQNIDTPTGKEEKAREDAYQDKAEAKYKEELKKQDAAKKAQPKGKGKPVQKVLPRTSAVK